MRTIPVSLEEEQHLALALASGTPTAGLRVGISHWSMVGYSCR